MNSENKGYSLAVINGNTKEKQEKVYLKPMALYVPDMLYRPSPSLFLRSLLIIRRVEVSC